MNAYVREETYNFGEAFNRMCDIVGIKTQKSLGTVLGISQPSVHYARTRQCIPTTWLLKLVNLGVNPEWILYGHPHKPYMQATDDVPSSGPVRVAADAAALAATTAGETTTGDAAPGDAGSGQEVLLMPDTSMSGAFIGTNSYEVAAGGDVGASIGASKETTKETDRFQSI